MDVAPGMSEGAPMNLGSQPGGVLLGQDIQTKFLEFLEEFIVTDPDLDTLSQASAPSEDDEHKGPYYVEQLAAMKDAEKTTLFVDFAHLQAYNPDLAKTIRENFYRLDAFLRKAVQNFVRHHHETYVVEENVGEKEFWVGFYNLDNPTRLRNLKTGVIGKLESFSATVTRTSEVRPELYLATFRCLECQRTVENVEQQFKFTNPVICPNPTCGNRKLWLLIREQSTFVDWQRVKVQELSDEVPAGSLPRTLDVLLRNDTVESVRAGDKICFNGTLLVVPDVSVVGAPGGSTEARLGGGNNGNSGNAATDSAVTGLKGLGVRELTYKLCFMACATQASDLKEGAVNIRADDDATPEEVMNQFTLEQQTDIEVMKRSNNIYQQLTASIAPGVYGHDDVKRAILLMLFGGVHKQTQEGINLRGDINVAIVGDPSCAKSQLLKYVAGFLPRAVYTSGKSSSAAGLTATVVKESDSNEFCIEAGALMLADNGICCIDEFDKMDVKDQVAIHEAMEQQTISIAKAGIQATLNARTSILAAANPIGGRYDRSKPLKYNLALPPAILSRFDMIHVMIDEPNDVVDYAIAAHIVAVHQHRNKAFNVPYDMAKMQRYIKYARSIKPEITPEAKELLVRSYRKLRGEDAAPGTSTAFRITVRQLEALVRLSEAIARMRCSPLILPSYVAEAVRLVKSSIIAIQDADVDVDDEGWVGEEEDAAALARAQAAAAPADSAAAMDVDEPAQAEAEAGPSGQEAAAAEQGAAAATPQQTRRPPPTKVTRKKFLTVRNLMVMKLREMEAGEEGLMLAGGVEVSSLSQRALLDWYFDNQDVLNAIQVAPGTEVTEALRRERALVEKIVQHLVGQHVLLVLQEPQQGGDEAPDAFQRRRLQERLLGVHPNYTEGEDQT